MRRKDFFKFLGSASVAGALGGCKGFLDVVPDERATRADAFQNRDAAIDSLYSCYNFMPAKRGIGTAVDLITVDTLVTPFTQKAVQHFPRGEYSPSNPVFDFWNNLYKGIRHCYILINNVDKTPKLSESNKVDFKAQAKFLIGYYSFFLTRMYGPIVVVEGVKDIAQDISNFDGRTPLKGSVAFVTNMLDEAAKDLPAKRTGQDYGLATSVAAKAVKAKMLLFAASPLFNGGGENKQSLYTDFKDKDGQQLMPASYDKQKWKKAADALKEAIDLAESVGHELYHASSSLRSDLPSDPVEKDLRFTFCDKNTNELLFADTRTEGYYSFQNNAEPFDSGHSWNGMGVTLRMVESFYTENGLPIEKDPDFDYQNRYSIADGPNGKTMALHLNRSPRFNAWVNYHNSYYEIKKGNKNQVLCRFRKNDNCGIKNRSNNYSPTGYLSKKGVHPLSDDKSGSFQNYPWPIIRLADLYLAYAEALIEYGQDFGTAKTYINKVRSRAGIPEVDQAWAPIGGANDKTTLRTIVRQERTNEFFLENQRFWDLRRWMEGEKLDTELKGLNIDGETNQEFFKLRTVPQERNFHIPENYLLPIPIGEKNKNPNLVQNPGY